VHWGFTTGKFDNIIRRICPVIIVITVGIIWAMHWASSVLTKEFTRTGIFKFLYDSIIEMINRDIVIIQLGYYTALIYFSSGFKSSLNCKRTCV
jgi:hypothetical protein